MADFAADLTAEPVAISALTERVDGFLKDRGVDARATHHVALVLDELLTNIAMHSETVEVRTSVRLTVLPEQVSAEILDGGMTFDPRSKPNGDAQASLDGPVGGLGLLLVHRLTDSLDYG